MPTTYTVQIDVGANADDSKTEIAQLTQRLTGAEAALKRTQAQLAKLTSTRGGPSLTARDLASPMIKKVMSSVTALAKQGVQIPIHVLDQASSKLKGVLETVTHPLALMGGAAGMAGLTVWPLTLAANMEQAQVGFENLFQSQQVAAQFMKDLRTFSTQTPHQFPELVTLSQQLGAAGVKADEIIPKLRKIADAAAVAVDPNQAIQSMTGVFANMRHEMAVGGGDLRTLDTYTNASQMIADNLGMNLYNFRMLVERGVVPATVAERAFFDEIEKRHPGAAKAQAATLRGLVSNITDLFNLNIVTKWGEGLSLALKPRLTALNTWFAENTDQVDRWSGMIKGAGSAVGNFVLDKLEGLMRSLNDLTQLDAWKNGSFGAKFALAWDRIIAEPFQTWWSSSGHTWAAQASKDVGQALGEGISGAVQGLFSLNAPGNGKPKHLREDERGLVGGMNPNQAESIGTTVGGSFASGFIQGFKSAKVGESIRDSILPEGLGGHSDNLTGSVAELGIGAYILRGPLSWLFKGGRALSGMFKGGAGPAASVASQLGPGAEQLALEGEVGGLARGGLGKLPILGALIGAIQIATASPKERPHAIGSVGGGLAGAEAGALLGTMVFPGVGTVVGGILGAIGGSLGGGALADKIFPPGDEPVRTFEDLDTQTNRLARDFANLADILEGILSGRSSGSSGGGGGSSGGGGPFGPIGGDKLFPSVAGALPAAGDIVGWRKVIAQQSGALGGNADFVNTVLAGGYAESGLDPMRDQVGGNGHGFFQFDTGGMGKGLSWAQLHDEQFQASRIIPEYARYWNEAPPELTGAAKAAWVAAHAEKPYDYENPNSAAQGNYRQAYSTVTSASNQSAVTLAPGAVVVHVAQIGTDPAAVLKFANTIADPVANAIAMKMEQSAANTVPTK